MRDNKLFLPLAVVVAGMFIAAAIYFGGGGPATTATVPTNSLTTQSVATVAPVTSSDHILGPSDAKVYVIEYSDLECPFCKAFHTTMRTIMNDYQGQSVAWVFREFPIASLHSRAPKEAEAAECAAALGGNDAFWNFVNAIFQTTNSNDSLDPAMLPQIAGELGLNVEAFNQCLSSGRFTNLIDQDVAAALKTGAQGTPYTVIVSGSQQIPIVGAQPYNTVKAAIDSLLK